KRVRAAVIIQKAWYTYNNEWTTFLLLGCLRELEVDEKTWEAQLHLHFRCGNARRIQRAFRAFVQCRRALLALRIQQAYRAFAARRCLARLQAQVVAHRRLKWWFRAHHARRNRIATRIQFWWRKAVSGRMLRHLTNVARRIREAETRATRWREYNAATTMQAIVHGVWTRYRVKKTKCAIAIQRNVRRLAAQRLAVRLRYERRMAVATACMARVLREVTFRLIERRMQICRARATTIQRVFRGQRTRQQLAEAWAWLDERTRMAQRVQRLWRQTAEKRFATRLLNLQRRRVANPFNHLRSFDGILETAVAQSCVHLDPYDPLVGMNLIGWLRRLGLDASYDILLQHGYKTVASLAKVTDAFLQSTCQIKEKDTRQLFLAGVHYQTWLKDVQTQRALVESLDKAHKRVDGPFQKAVKDVQDHKAVVSRWQYKLEKALAESAEFKHAPKAVKKKQMRAEKALAGAEKALADCEAVRATKAAAATAARDKWQQAKDALKPMEANEVKAVFLTRAAQVVDSTEAIKSLFLDTFPNQEFRAVRFVESLHDKPVTLGQLLRFFTQYTTISDVKFHSAELIYSKHEPDIAAHDHARLVACCDLLQFAVERIGDLVHMPIVSMVDRHATSPISMCQTILRGLQDARQAPLPKRPLVWRECIATLRAMHTSAQTVQRLWRTRQGRQMVAALRQRNLRSALAEQYAAERDRQNVRRVWEDDLKKAQAMLAARVQEAAHAALLEELSMTLRFGYAQEWHDEYQMWYYVCVATGEMVWERPSYGEVDLDAAKRIGRAVRRFLGKCRRAAHRRMMAKWTKYGKEKVVWEAKWMDRKRFVTLRIRGIATARPDVITWRAGTPALTSSSTADALDACRFRCHHAYHKSVRKDHRGHLLLPIYARPPNAHAAALLEFLHAYAKLVDMVRPASRVEMDMAYTRVEMPFGWAEIPEDQVYFYHAASGAVTWDEPEYSFDDEWAARKMQSAFRMLQGRRAFQKMLQSFSFVELLHASIKSGAAVGWVGFGLEGMSLPVFLGRVGMLKQIPSLVKANVTVDDLASVADDKWLGLGVVWSKEERALLQSAPRVVRGTRRLAPLTARMSVLPEKHGFHVLPSEKVLTQLLMAHFTGQQGRVQSIVRAFRDLGFPVSFKQLEMYIRGYTGRPAQAVDNILEIVPKGSTTQDKEVELYRLFRHAVQRCAIVASNLKLLPLAQRLNRVLKVAQSIHGVKSDHKLAISATPLAPDDLTWVVHSLPSVKGLWENNIRETAKLSVAQAALWLRQDGLEFMLRYIRSTTAVQATFRMARLRKWYLAVVAHRNQSALVIQLAWRCAGARAVRAWYLDEQRADYEEHFVESSQLYYYIYVPTQERMHTPPVDAFGASLAFRPLVIDRLTRKWILAWPWLASSNQASDAAANAFESNVVCSICNYEKASRVCDVCATSRGDYLYYCFACYCTAHPPALAWHTYQPLNRLHAQPLRCVECTRLSSFRCLVCNEDYCDRCFARIHSKGKRASHLVESYEPRSQVCIECEQRVALQTCAVCTDALCGDCVARTHARGNKAKHEMVPIFQTLPPGSVHCLQCKSRVADKMCRHCAGPVCRVCLETTHQATCLETQLEEAKKKLLGDNVCVDCGKPADRMCEHCGDKYCSVRWMGNPGCFERFHAKGKRIEHEVVPLDVPPIQLTPEAAALERKVLAQQAATQAAADAAMQAQVEADKIEHARLEREQRAFAAEIQRAKKAIAAAAPPVTAPPEPVTKSAIMFRKPKKQAPRCTTPGCVRDALRGFPHCTTHCTPQNLLALGYDAKAAAKILAMIERMRLRKEGETATGGSLLTKVKRELKVMPFFNE
ncbi:hypothetical protein As57867_021528, partial [Aphanomyces stellatus]